eukprot:10124069-Alexandrium_andersonii.AAC.1
MSEVELGFFAKEQHRCWVKFRVAAVKRPLLAVSALAQAGNDVHFDISGGRIVSRATKRVIHCEEVDSVYVLD